VRRRAWLGLPIAGLVLPGCAVLPTTDAFASADLRHAVALRDAGLRDTHAARLLHELAAGIGPRPAGSDGDRRAVAWAQDALRGLQLAAVRAEPVPVRVWQRGPASARLLAPGPRTLVMAALGNSVPTPAAGLEAELAVYPDLAALMADTSDRARGRIVFIDQRTERTRDGSGYGRAVGARIAGPVEAARRGAVALALRSIGTDREAIAHTGATRYDLRVPRIPAFAVSVPDAEHIAALQAVGTPMRMQVSLQARSDVEAVTHNVIAELPGGDLAQEVVLIGAHLDSWDLGQGALDNAAGVGIVSAAAAVIAAAGRQPRRTIRVVLFANEENGFDGARAYGDRHGGAIHQLVAESDFGAGAIYRLSSRVQPEARLLVQALAEVLAPLGVEPGGDAGTPGPDAALLMRRHRWPALQLHQDGSRYFDVHHTERDTVDQADPAALRQNVACWAACAWLAAQSPIPFGPPTL
jgi:carboxypeptidase Q